MTSAKRFHRLSTTLDGADAARAHCHVQVMPPPHGRQIPLWLRLSRHSASASNMMQTMSKMFSIVDKVLVGATLLVSTASQRHTRERCQAERQQQNIASCKMAHDTGLAARQQPRQTRPMRPPSFAMTTFRAAMRVAVVYRHRRLLQCRSPYHRSSNIRRVGRKEHIKVTVCRCGRTSAR